MRIIGHGIDLIEVSRIREMLDRHPDRFAERVFTQRERDYAADRKRGVESLAARFAAKEAVFKALGTGWRDGLAWTEIEIMNDAMGKPSVVLTGAAAARAASLGIDSWQISLSHTADHAMASAIACGA